MMRQLLLLLLMGWVMSKFKMIVANNPILEKKRELARTLCLKLNNLDKDGQETDKQKLYNKLFRIAGEKLEIWNNFFCEFGENISFGDRVFVHCNCVINDTMSVDIGNDVKIGANTEIHTTIMGKNPERRKEYKEYGISVSVGEDVYIGSNVLILPGVTIEPRCYIGNYVVLAEKVTIGAGSHIGAGMVITKNIALKSDFNKKKLFNFTLSTFKLYRFIKHHSLKILVGLGGLGGIIKLIFEYTS